MTTVIPFVILMIMVEIVIHVNQEVRGMEQSENTGTQEYTEPLKKVALTFDDGPNPIYTPELLDGLEKRNVKATFFLLGEAVEDYPDIAKRIYEDGHLIGNHTYDHVNLGNLCENAACEQVRKTNEIIERVTGYYPEYVRPPFGEWKENIDNDVTMIKVLWNVDPLDWATGNADAVVERVVGKCEDNDIILMHDASESSVKAALRIIDILTKKGYEFVTVDQLILD
ncbi:polysaccharide deacetylase family protein [Roseburia sp. MUC/MUC-530-WT-4D]|uniref:Polysaccharide deacetylase family protein n=2 Tax=Roseburia porci TaxID=2605790 RepID=A0A6L5YPN6_9FIRM|nr:polysaccharide deacetylase family protein [Roseburia porci]